MAVELRMPLLGDVMQEGTIVEWLKQDGEWVEQGEALFSVETDKVVVEVDSPGTGRLKCIAGAGDAVAVGGAVGLLLDAEEHEAGTASSTAATTSLHPVQAAHDAVGTRSEPSGDELDEVRASPLARRLARLNGLDLRQIVGTGPRGRIVEADINDYLQQAQPGVMAPAPPTETTLTGTGLPVGASRPLRTEQPESDLSAAQTGERRDETVTPLRGRRRTIADRMQHSLQTMAQLTIGREVDVTRLVDLRSQLLTLWEVSESVRITYTDLVLKATALALREHRDLNARVVDDAIHLLPDVDVAIAVDVPGGLTVPVVRAADRRSLLELARDTRRLTELARTGRLTQDDLAGGSFTISAMGSLDVDWFTPIVNPPQVAILGIGRIRTQPAIVNGQLAERHVMNLCLTFDHRALDGGPPARFLGRVAQLLETPVALLT